MARFADEYMPPEPGPLIVRDAVRKHLYVLRRIDRLVGRRHRSDWEPPAPVLEAALAEQVERALKCTLPDEILAAFAARAGDLIERGFRIDAVYDNTLEARGHRLGKEYVAVGADQDLYFCVRRNLPHDRGVTLAVFCVEDGQTNSYDFADWLAELVRSRIWFFADELPELKTWEPTAEEVAAFSLELV